MENKYAKKRKFWIKVFKITAIIDIGIMGATTLFVNIRMWRAQRKVNEQHRKLGGKRWK